MKRTVLRAILGAYAAVASAATLEAQDTARLKYVAIAHQDGPVGYRDPLGVISPSGEWLAYSIAHRLFVQRLVGGPVTELPSSTATIRHLAWLPDDHTLAARGETQLRV